MSMFSMISSKAAPRATVSRNGYRLTTDQIDGDEAVFLHLGAVLVGRPAQQPPCTRGCSVLTRPSRISGAPVKSLTSRTGTPGLAQRVGGAAGRQDLDARRDEPPAEVGEARLVGDRDECARGLAHGASLSRPTTRCSAICWPPWRRPWRPLWRRREDVRRRPGPRRRHPGPPCPPPAARRSPRRFRSRHPPMPGPRTTAGPAAAAESSAPACANDLAAGLQRAGPHLARPPSRPRCSCRWWPAAATAVGLHRAPLPFPPAQQPRDVLVADLPWNLM